MAFVDFDTKKMSYEKWLCNHKNGRQTFSNFLRKKERAFIANELAEGTSYIKIWKFLKKKNKMPFAYRSFIVWCKKEFGNQKRKNSTFSNSHSNPPTFSNNDVFRMDLPIDDDSLKPAETLPKNELAKNNYSHSIKSLVASYKRIGKEKFIEKLKEQEKEFDRQGIEGVFVLDKSLKI